MSYGKFAYVYDELMQDMPYAKWKRFAQEAWDKFGRPREVVELGCGTGTLTALLAQEGYAVTGIDLSEDMLAVARAKAEERPPLQGLLRGGELRFVQQDMTEWAAPEPVDSVISFCDCLNYLTEPEQIEDTFRATYAGLKPGGTFLFDVHHPDTLRRYEAEQPFVYDEDGISYIWTCGLDEERTEIEHHLRIFVRRGEDAQTAARSEAAYDRFDEVHIERAYDPDWLKAALLRAGFSRAEVYADFEWQAPEEGSERLFYVAVR
ncbi:class I SAM-dependent methyltransferase [Saccharibacillus sp. CPCC 101409]|uniref:class I SAM-dependent DNA methyltransferase n=1 Tax=Saccharibacillus sp. CPCC 101409 TaxID=3058041 RepID=UPI002671A2AC|nr:class I SAM-dependent methyltransferase [Saccharibacillus sp. CPCC 101409]MDO3409090.1 class I SAM-dependent methyltransferase [Saccharibacillus sp. CPCC 101409]